MYCLAQLGGIVCYGHGGDHTKRIHLNAGVVCTLRDLRLYSQIRLDSFVLRLAVARLPPFVR